MSVRSPGACARWGGDSPGPVPGPRPADCLVAVDRVPTGLARHPGRPAQRASGLRAAIARIAGLCASITGGLSSSAQIPRLDHGRIQRRVLQPWKIDSLSRVTVTPDTREALATTLTLTADCEANGAVCTWDGRALSTGEARLVLVPGPET